MPTKQVIELAAQRRATFLQLLPKHNMNITHALKSMGLSRATFDSWRKNHPEFMEAYNEILNEGLDKDLLMLKEIIGEIPDENGELKRGIHSEDHRERRLAADALMFRIKHTHPEFKRHYDQGSPAPTTQNQILIFVGGERVELNELAKNMMEKMKIGDGKNDRTENADTL